MDGPPVGAVADITVSRRRTTTCVAGYLAVWTASAAFLATMREGSIVEPLFILCALGVAFPAVALAATRKSQPAAEPIARPAVESGATVLYLALFSVVVLGWGFWFLREQVPAGRTREVVTLAVKLLTMCAGPGLLFRALGTRAVPRGALGPRSSDLLPGIVLAIALLAFQCVFGGGLRQLSELHPSAGTLAWAIPAAFVWLTLEAGLTEEVLFRAVLQTRLAAFLRTEPGAIVVGAALFGLAHAPGLYLRGGSLAEGLTGPPTAAWAIAYSIAIVSPAGLLFGVLWWRTRSLALLVLLHGWTDLLPNLAGFIRTWRFPWS